MNLMKKILKKLPFTKNIIVSIKFISQYKYDFKFYLKNYSHSKETKNKLGYNILLATHSLEKGMSIRNLRYFGITKTKDIIDMLKKYATYGNYENDYAFINGINVLRSYVKIYESQNWTNRDEYKYVKDFIDNYKNINKMDVGSFTLTNKEANQGKEFDYNKFLSGRRSVRNYKNKKISEKDIEAAVNMALKSPTACNRQMVKIYYVSNEEKANEIIKIGQGFGGFELEGVNIFIVTFDINANYFIGERNQGWFNAGLVSMNFVNALHSLGIGTCFIQFGNTTKEEELVKRILNIPSSERIAVLISAGYYATESKIPYSPRKSINDIYKKID